ncbi:hypothetical protein TXYLGN1_14570 [Tepidimicrobium xylanilyticum]|nr:hypothetical protein EN5CB1_27820 [Tepidimicrobium xylanilyticum]
MATVATAAPINILFFYPYGYSLEYLGTKWSNNLVNISKSLLLDFRLSGLLKYRILWDLS